MRIRNLIELSEKERNELKQVQLDLLVEFSNFCNANSLTFYLFGGTLLGAVRHQGFIPWDDDIDVCMPRSDYDKFCEIYKENENFFLQNTKTDKKYFYHFSKLTKKDTTYNEYLTQRIGHIKNVFIDIFPINCVPTKRSFSYLHYNFWVFILNKKSYPISLTPLKKKKQTFTYKLMTIVSWILLWWCSYHFASILRDRFMKKHQYANSGLCIVGTRLKKYYPTSCFEGETLVKFENLYMPAPLNYREYLKIMYGDYLSLPPLEERIAHHYLVEFKGTKNETR